MLQIRTLLTAAAGWAILSLVVELPATAALLSSGGANDNHVAVANYAASYDGDSIVVELDCVNGSAKKSEFKAATYCDSSSGSCAAQASTSNSNAFLSIPPHQKGDLYYFASDHSAAGQGTCSVSLEASIAGHLGGFTLDFNFHSNAQNAFTVSFQDLDPGWLPTTESGIGARCPGTGTSLTGPLARPVFTNNNPIVAHNVICNEDFIVSLVSGGPRDDCIFCFPVNHGAILTVNNNPYGIQQAWQESVAANEVNASGSTAAGPAGMSATTLAEGLERRRLANRIYDGMRWVIVADPNERTLAGVVLDQNGTEQGEIVSCELLSGDGNADSQAELSDYLCDFTRVAAESAEVFTRMVRLPGAVTQAPPRVPATSAGMPPQRSASVEGVLAMARATRDLAKTASTNTASEGKPNIWYGDSRGGHIAMVKSEAADSVEIVTHHPDSLSPIFLTCGKRSVDLRKGTYACRVSPGCRRSPCNEESWSPSVDVEFPNALFKSRPCQPGQGGNVVRQKLTLVDLGEQDGPAGLKFRSQIEFEESVRIRPDEAGFRLLIEDAEGDTVVDLDIPGNERRGKGKARRGERSEKNDTRPWKVEKHGKAFKFRSRATIDGMVPKVRIERDDEDRDLWKVTVRGKRGIFDGDDLALPLTVSASFDPATPASDACFGIDFSEDGEGGSCQAGASLESITCK